MSATIINNQQSIYYIIPALIIVGTVFLILLLSILKSFLDQTKLIRYTAIIGLSTAFYANNQSYQMLDIQAGIYLFNDLFYMDAWAINAYQLIIACTLIILCTPYPSNDQSSIGLYEMMLLSSLLGSYGMLMANHWLVIYVHLACISICSTVLIYTSADSQKNLIPSFNYFIYQMLMSSLMLWGMAYLYGIGCLSFTSGLIMDVSQPLTVLASCLVLTGISAQIGLFPFHFWIIDVYSKAAIPTVAYLSTIPKLTALAVLARIYSNAQSKIHLSPNLLILILTIIASLTLLIGHLGALRQNRLRGVLAYASIAQSGLLLVGIITSTHEQAGLSYYSLFYTLASLVAWISIGMLEAHMQQYKLGTYAGLGKQLPIVSISLTIGLLSFIGLPPTMGLTAKWLIFSTLWSVAQVNQNYWLYLLGLIGLLGTILALYYYLKILYALFFQPPQSTPTHLIIAPKMQTLLIGLTIILVILFFVANTLLNLLTL